jgi:hypothetical protein
LYEAARFKLLDLDRGDTLSRLSRSSPAALSRNRFETFDMNHPKSRTIIRFLALAIKVAAAQSSRLAVFGGRGMSFNICSGTLGCRLAVLIAAILHSRCGCPKIGTGAHGEAAVSELTPAQASEKCHKHLVAGLRLIRPAERVGAIAKALQELEARQKTTSGV